MRILNRLRDIRVKLWTEMTQVFSKQQQIMNQIMKQHETVVMQKKGKIVIE